MAAVALRKFVRVEVGGAARWGMVDGDAIVELPEGPFGDTPVTGTTLGSIDEVDLLAPTVPTKIIGVGRNYVEHAAEHGVEVPSQPLLFTKPASSVLAPGGVIELPRLSSKVEYEGEMAVVMGRRCRHVREDEAWLYVLGVTCGNDVTARDIQRADAQWTRGKGFDTFAPLGPWIVCGLSESEAGDLEVSTRVNGETRQRGRASQMVFSSSFLISYISAVMTLEPGDVIMTGTPKGVGPLADGDHIEVEVERVGVLSNRVEAEVR
jgi:2-keto-4-pentenoate hydratase/2-oxohepta-3-ene-1,7-dioic acid hydratase in catechol pathway